MKKIILVAMAAGMLVQTAGATTRYNLFDMTTSEARELVEDRGAVLFNTNADKPYVFNRVVKSRFYCDSASEVTRPFFGLTLDSGNSKDIVGKVCEDFSNR